MRGWLKTTGLYWLYQLVWLLIALPYLLVLVYRYRDYPQHNRRFAERLGLYRYRCSPSPCKFWLHLASVGEVMAALPLLHELQKHHPLDELLITTTTPTGEKVLRDNLGGGVNHRYLPFDHGCLMKRLIKKAQPQCLIIFETELWPGMLRACQDHNVPAVLINGRLSERSLQRYQGVELFSRELFGQLTQVLAQTQADAERFAALGVNAVKVTGSIKSDVIINPAQRIEAQQQRKAWGERPVLIAASTHEGEETLILEAFTTLKQTFTDLLLVLVPRHPQRSEAIAAECQRSGLSVVKRSIGESPTESTAVLLVDTVGELFTLYGTADVAVMGGSFIDHGGHNPLEPAAWGLPLLSGPSFYNFAKMAKELAKVQALMQVGSPAALADQVEQLLSDSVLHQQRGEAAKAYLQHQPKVVDTIINHLKPWMEVNEKTNSQ